MQCRACPNALDFGCSSGVLALLPWHLALNTPTAQTLTHRRSAMQDNAQRNGVSDQIQTYLPDAFEPAEPYELVMANISSGPLVELRMSC